MRLIIGGILLLCMAFSASGQSIAPAVYASSGTVYSSANAQISWTAGEALVSSRNAGNSALTEGFQQPTLTVVAIGEALPELHLEVFPNPTQEHLTLQFPEASKGAYTAELYNVAGQRLQEKAIPTGANQASIDLTQVADGHYYLRVTNHTRQVSQTFKVQKIN